MMLWKKGRAAAAAALETVEADLENPGTTEEAEELLEPEKKDLPAMWISAMLVLWIPSVLILILLCAVVCLPFFLL